MSGIVGAVGTTISYLQGKIEETLVSGVANKNVKIRVLVEVRTKII